MATRRSLGHPDARRWRSSATNASNRRGLSSPIFLAGARSPRPRRSTPPHAARSRAAPPIPRDRPEPRLGRGVHPRRSAHTTLFAQCLRSVLDHTPPDVPVLVTDDASDDPACARLVEEVNAANPERPPVGYLRQPENVGFVHNVNDALRPLAPADVIVLNSDCVVPRAGTRAAPGRLFRHARGDRLDADEPRHDRLGARAQPAAAEPAAGLVARGRRRRGARRQPGCTPRCPQRSATACTFAAAPSSWSGTSTRRSRRAMRRRSTSPSAASATGLSHVLADDVLVLHYGGGSFDSAERRRRSREAPPHDPAATRTWTLGGGGAGGATRPWHVRWPRRGGRCAGRR